LAAFAIGTIGRRGPEQLPDVTTGEIMNSIAFPVLAAPHGRIQSTWLRASRAIA
jgi:hypothetical protein